MSGGMDIIDPSEVREFENRRKSSTVIITSLFTDNFSGPGRVIGPVFVCVCVRGQ